MTSRRPQASSTTATATLAPSVQRAAVPLSRSNANAKKNNADVLDALAPDRVENNNRVVEYSRTFMAIVAGCATGILGYTGLQGFFCFLCMSLLVSVALLAKCGFNVQPYFLSWTGLVFGGLLQGFGSFILFWVLAYDVVHIYS